MTFSKSVDSSLRISRKPGNSRCPRSYGAVRPQGCYVESLPTHVRKQFNMEGRGTRRFSTSLGVLDAGAFDREGHLRTTSVQTATRRDSIARVAELSRSFTESRDGFTRYQVLTLITLCLVNFCNAICYSLLAPFYPKEAGIKGVSGLLIGLIFGVFEFVIFITSPFFGTYITQIGSRFLFVAGIFVAGVCAILFGFLDQAPAGSVYIAMCFVVRIVQALGCSGFMTASFAIVANTFPTRVATMFGTLETFNGLGMMTGPVIGGALYEAGGFYLPFFVTGGILILSAVFSIFILPAQNDAPKAQSTGSVFSLLRIPAIAVVALSIMLASCTLGFMEPTLAEHLTQFNLSTALVGVMFLVASGLYAATAPLWGFIGDRFGRTKSVMLFGNIGVGVSFLLLGPCPLIMQKTELWLVIVSLVILGVSIGASLVPSLQESLENALSNGYEDNFETYGFVSGIFASCFSLGACIGPVGGGFMVEKLGFPWASTIVGLMVFALAMVMLIFYTIERLCCTPRVDDDFYSSISQETISDSTEYNVRTPLVRNNQVVT